MQKPRISELRKRIKAVQADILENTLPFNETDHLAGHCQENRTVAESFSTGAIYDTRLSSEYGRWGHTVAVVITKGSKEGKVVDVTQERGIIGTVRDARDTKSVEGELSHLFSVGGWQRRR